MCQCHDYTARRGEVTGSNRRGIWASTSLHRTTGLSGLSTRRLSGEFRVPYQGMIGACYHNSQREPITVRAGEALSYLIELVPFANLFLTGHRNQLADQRRGSALPPNLRTGVGYDEAGPSVAANQLQLVFDERDWLT